MEKGEDKVKKLLKSIFMMSVMVMAFAVTGITASAAPAKPATPKGVILYDYEGSTVQVNWKIDPNLSGVSFQEGNWYGTCGWGYEAVFMTAKGKTIKTTAARTFDSQTATAVVTSSKLKNAAYKVKIRSYLSYKDANGNVQYVYSSPATKTFVPRAVIKRGKAIGGGKAKIYWNKVSGAKSYTMYISSNNGKSFKKVGTTKKTSMNTKTLKKYKNYYVYVQANGVKVSGKRYNSTKMTKKKIANAYKFYIYTYTVYK